MRYYVILICTLSWAVVAEANMVSGIVRSYRSLGPLPGVAVNAAIVGSDSVISTVTDPAGYYQITVVPPVTLAFRFVFAGYCDYLDTVVVEDENDDEILSPLLLDAMLGCSVTYLSVLTWPGHDMYIQFQISNPGGECLLEFVISDTSEWLSAAPDSGTIAPDSAQTITVFMDADYLYFPGDERQSVLRIDHNAANSPYIIPVSFYTESQPGSAPNPPEILPSSVAFSAYPNPFNPKTTISFSIPRTSQICLRIYDVSGRETATVANRYFVAGQHSIVFDASALPSGVYFAQLVAGTQQVTRKIMLLK